MIYLWQGNFLRDGRNAGTNCTLVRKYPRIPMVSGMKVHENGKDIFIIKTGGIV
jgi:hypothetical protein